MTYWMSAQVRHRHRFKQDMTKAMNRLHSFKAEKV